MSFAVNKKIAIFMGYKVWDTESGCIAEVDGFAGHFSSFKEFNYDSDWNLIMEVIEYIEKLGYIVSPGSYQTQIFDKQYKMIIDADFCNTFKANTYQAIEAFIMWKNTQPCPTDTK